MKVFMLILLAQGVVASETNFFPMLTAGSTTYTNARITSTTATYAIVWHDGGGSRVALTNLPPELQQRFGYDPAKAKEAEAKDARARAKYQERGKQLANQRAYQTALTQARQNYNAKFRAASAPLEQAKARVNALRAEIEQLRVNRDAAWNRYIHSDSSAFRLHNNRAVDSEAIRHQTAQAADRDLASARDELLEAQEDLRREETKLREIAPKLIEEYMQETTQIHELFGR
jgi:chromosome segregation ATPase